MLPTGSRPFNKHVAGGDDDADGNARCFYFCWISGRVNPTAPGSTTGPERLGAVYSGRYPMINRIQNSLPDARVVVIIFIVLQ